MRAGARERVKDAAEAATHGAGPAAGPAAPWGSLVSALWYAVPLAAAMLIGFLLASLKTGWEEQRLIEGTVAHFGVWKGLRPGLSEHLAEVAGSVQAIRAAVEGLPGRRGKLPRAEASAEREDIEQISDALDRMQHNVKVIAAAYGYDAAEMDALKALFADKLAELSPLKERASPSPEKKRAPRPRQSRRRRRQGRGQKKHRRVPSLRSRVKAS